MRITGAVVGSEVERACDALRSQIEFLRYTRRGLPIGAQRDALTTEIGRCKRRLRMTDEQWTRRRADAQEMS